MNRYIFLSLMLIGFLSLGFFWQQNVSAQSDVPMTEAHIARIRSNCVEAQSQLQQLNVSDALLRVNRGQLYESISTKLMAPFNSRIALAKLDGADLVSSTVEYEKMLNTFRSDYQLYAESLSQTLVIKCKDQPVSFYDSVRSSRDKRSKVAADVVALQALINKYKNNFEAFAIKVGITAK